jgi:hypothetical protein
MGENTGVNLQLGLTQAVQKQEQMWPTPTSGRADGDESSQIATV